MPDTYNTFDWDKAVRLILERKPDEVVAGLEGDWSCTRGVIYSDGIPKLNHEACLGSTWARPQIDLDG